MAKILVRTTGSFMLMDGIQEVPHDRSAVVENSSFIQSRISLGQLELVSAEIGNTATDKDYYDYWVSCDRDDEMAAASFASKFAKSEEPVADEAVEEEAPHSGGRRGRRRGE